LIQQPVLPHHGGVQDNGRVRAGGTSNSPAISRLLMVKEKRTPSLLMPDDVAGLLSVTRKTVVAMARDGRVSSLKIGRFVRLGSTEIDRCCVTSGDDAQVFANSQRRGYYLARHDGLRRPCHRSSIGRAAVL
jgi:excisionase family DNA binding protein